MNPIPAHAKPFDPDAEPGVWTSIEDDTGGGRSLTGHAWLYMQTSSDKAAEILLSVFGCHAGHETDPYGPAFSFRQAESFAAASGRDRGCGFDSASRRHIEAPRNGYTPYKTPADYASTATLCPIQCQRTCELALRDDAPGSRYGRIALFRRLTCLAALCAARRAGTADQLEFAAAAGSLAPSDPPDSLLFCQRACIAILDGLSFPGGEPGQAELAGAMPACIQALLPFSCPDSLTPQEFAAACAAAVARAAGPAGQEDLAPFFSAGFRQAPEAAEFLAKAAIAAGIPMQAGLYEQALLEARCLPPNSAKAARKL